MSKRKRKFPVGCIVEFIDAPGYPFKITGFNTTLEETEYFTQFGWVKESELRRSKSKRVETFPLVSKKTQEN